MSPGFCKRALTGCAVLLASVAALVAGCIVPAMSGQSQAGTAGSEATDAFWAVAASALVAAVLLWVLASRFRTRTALTMGVLGVITVVVLLLALLLNDAAMAYWGLDVSLHGAALAAFAAAAVCLVVATTVLSTAFLLPGRRGGRADD